MTKQTTQILIGVGSFFVLAIILFFVFRNKEEDTDISTSSLDADLQSSGCVTPPSSFKTYNQDSINWSDLESGYRKYLDEVNSDTKSKAHAYLKMIDVQPTKASMKKYKNAIKAYIKSDVAQPHWDVEVGVNNCSNLNNNFGLARTTYFR